MRTTTFVRMYQLLAITLLVAAPASAQVYGLAPAEKSAVIDAASRRSDSDNPALLPALPQDRRPHGEIGAMIGTGGARGIYGSIDAPLGNSGSAAFAFSHTRIPGIDRYRSQGPGFLGRNALDRQNFGFKRHQPDF